MAINAVQGNCITVVKKTWRSVSYFNSVAVVVDPLISLDVLDLFKARLGFGALQKAKTLGTALG